ncbi:HNH endonuclease [Thiothrix subterranea]|uniref:HNH endonuclease n=1 Tax=Thiothrix subterranea TaxID=2735563 RepID=A0AA51R4R1_9GAMM|nr:HNH endonuclease [Thiothrix subterranea]MDQ5770586.1 HNH endonuclease [Thiothrix subterranea]WML86931.1 HNH endonuclease [Thiothrix subterranea]
MNPLYGLIASRAKHRCEYCHAPEVIFNFPFEVEHIIPLALDGSSHGSNLALSCRSCNLYKSSHINGVDPETQRKVRLFNPRNDEWSEHFMVNTETAEIIGLTENGRTTVLQLKMNKPSQLAARKQWMLLELFP